MVPGGWELVVIVVVLLLLFGAKRLPEMARSVGRSARVFKGEMKGLREDEGRPADTSPSASSTPSAPPSSPRPPSEPAALPPGDGQVDRPVAGTTGAGGPPVRPVGGEPVRDADR